MLNTNKLSIKIRNEIKYLRPIRFHPIAFLNAQVKVINKDYLVKIMLSAKIGNYHSFFFLGTYLV